MSVIIPFKNEEKTIPYALDSLEIQDTDFPFEIILADGCSTDDSVEVIRNHPVNKKADVTVLPLPEDNHGMTVARNKAADAARGEYLLLMQSDVRVTDKQALSKVARAFDKPGTVGTYAIALSADREFEKYDFWGKVMMARYQGVIDKKDFGTKFNGVRSDVFKKMGGFDEKRFAWGGEDFDFMARLLKEGEIAETDIRFEHLHALGKTQTAVGAFRKYCRNAEVMGVTFPVLLKGLGLHPLIPKMLIQETGLCLLGVSCLIPQTWPWSLLLLFLAGITWQAKSFVYIRDWRVAYLPFFGSAAMIAFVWFFLKGLITRKTSV